MKIPFIDDTEYIGDSEKEKNARLRASHARLLEALKGVVRVADRATDEFDAARAAIEVASEFAEPLLVIDSSVVADSGRDDGDSYVESLARNQQSVAIHQWRRVDRPEAGWFDDTHERAYHADPKMEGRTLYSIPKTAQQQEPLKLALEALEGLTAGREAADCYEANTAITAIKEALAQPQEKPEAWIEHEWSGTGLRKLHFERREPTVRDEVVNPVWTPIYTSPPAQRKPLTDEQCGALLGPFPKYASEWGYGDFYQFARAIEAAHGIK